MSPTYRCPISAPATLYPLAHTKILLNLITRQAMTFALILKINYLAHEFAPVSNLCPWRVQNFKELFPWLKVLTFARSTTIRSLDTCS